jgi:hypothetical protein
MFDVAKRGSITAMIFWLKAKAGWRHSDPFGPGFSVNVNTGQGDTIQAERERAARRRALLKLLTVDERKLYLNLLRVAAERQQAQEGKGKQPPIETPAQPVPETQGGANSPEMPIPCALFAGAK